MKRIISFILCIAISFSFAACQIAEASPSITADTSIPTTPLVIETTVPVETSEPIETTIPEESTLPTEVIDPSDISVHNLDLDATVGIGPFLHYADEDLIIFIGYFGLFGYDLNTREFTFSVDLKRTIGTQIIQGSGPEFAISRIPPDGSIVILYNGENPDKAYYIDPRTGAYEIKPYEELNEVVQRSFWEDGHMGLLTSTETDGTGGTIGQLIFTRNGETWYLFENWEN